MFKCKYCFSSFMLLRYRSHLNLSTISGGFHCTKFLKNKRNIFTHLILMFLN